MGSSNTPANNAATEGVAEAAAASVAVWGRLEFGDGNIVHLNVAVGARYVIGRVASACDYVAVDSWTNPQGTLVI